MHAKEFSNRTGTICCHADSFEPYALKLTDTFAHNWKKKVVIPFVPTCAHRNSSLKICLGPDHNNYYYNMIRDGWMDTSFWTLLPSLSRIMSPTSPRDMNQIIWRIINQISSHANFKPSIYRTHRYSSRNQYHLTNRIHADIKQHQLHWFRWHKHLIRHVFCFLTFSPVLSVHFSCKAGIFSNIFLESTLYILSVHFIFSNWATLIEIFIIIISFP